MNDTVVYLFILQAMHGGGCVHIYFYCIDFSHSSPISLIISWAPILMKEVLLLYSPGCNGVTHSFFFIYIYFEIIL